MTEYSRRATDASKHTLTIRDVLLLLAGCLGMYGAQIGVQWGMRSDIRDLKTSIDGYQQRQSDANSSFQRQIDDVRKASALNLVNGASSDKEMAELKGYLKGIGIKGVPDTIQKESLK